MKEITLILIALTLVSCNSIKEKLGAIPPSLGEHSLQDESLIPPPFYQTEKSIENNDRKN